MSNMNGLGFPNTSAFRPAAVSTAATMDPVPKGLKKYSKKNNVRQSAEKG
jgi:hypothetical protein